MSRKLTVLATAYAVNPYKGSEDGMGWNFILQIARYQHVIAITRENNRPAIERYQLENPSSLYGRIEFAYYDLPKYARFWKRGSRGAMLYYYLWQRSIVGFIRRQDFRYDIIHNLNFHNDWTPSFLWRLKKPFVWGPIGHHPDIPDQYLRVFSFRLRIGYRLRWFIKSLFWKYSRSLRDAIHQAQHIWVMNSEVAEVISLNGTPSSLMPTVACHDHGIGDPDDQSFHIISVGRLVPLKGFDLTLEAFARFMKRENFPTGAQLTIVGSGPLEEQLGQRADELGVSDQVTFIPWIEREALMQMYGSYHVFMFPSHEGAGMVVPEALSFGLPVICLDNCGPGEMIDDACGFAITQGSRDETIEGLSDALSSLHADRSMLSRFSKAARQQYLDRFTWEAKGNEMTKVYHTIQL